MATVVSILPIELGPDVLMKPGLRPGMFTIPACKDWEKDFVFIKVPMCEHSYLPPLADKAITIPVLDTEVARAIVEDYINSCLSIAQDSRPGLFWFAENLNKEQIKTQKVKELAEARGLQKQWFIHLVELADRDYSKTGHAMSVSDTQKLAATHLNLQRPWNVTLASLDTRCPVCQQMVRPDAIVCQSCRAVLKPEEYKKFQFAGGA